VATAHFALNPARDGLGKDYPWSVSGAGRNQIAVAVEAIAPVAPGGNIRVASKTRS
jgi:hypothetical protein